MTRLPLPEKLGMLFVCEADGTPREQSEIAHKLLRDCLPEYVNMRGIACADHPAVLRTEMGKPYFAEDFPVQFNLTHCKGLAACLLTDKPCGVDAERIRPLRPPVVRRAYSEAEKAALEISDDPDRLFTRMWTLKEAYVKAIGVGISYPLREVSFTLKGDTAICSIPDAVFWQTVYGEHIISVCTLKNA